MRDSTICGPLGCLYADDDGADAVARAVALGARLLLARQHRLDAAELDDDVAVLEALDGAVDHLADAVVVLGVDVLALGLAHVLEDDLLGGLRGDAAEHVGRHGEVDLVADLGVLLMVLRLVDGPLGERILDLFHHLLDDESLELAGLTVETRPHRFLDAVLLLGRRRHGILESADPALEVDVLLPRHLAQDLVQVQLSRLCLRHFQVPSYLRLSALQLDLESSLPYVS